MYAHALLVGGVFWESESQSPDAAVRLRTVSSDDLKLDSLEEKVFLQQGGSYSSNVTEQSNGSLEPTFECLRRKLHTFCLFCSCWQHYIFYPTRHPAFSSTRDVQCFSPRCYHLKFRIPLTYHCIKDRSFGRGF